MTMLPIMPSGRWLVERDLPKPTEDPDRLLKFALIFSGLASMAALAIWV